MTSEENARSRQALVLENGGEKRINAIMDVLKDIERELNNAGNSDAFYGKTDCFLQEVEELVRNYQAGNCNAVGGPGLDRISRMLSDGLE